MMLRLMLVLRSVEVMLLMSDLDIPPLQLDGEPGQVGVGSHLDSGRPHLVLLPGLLGRHQGNAY